jgi:hypothetical protein
MAFCTNCGTAFRDDERFCASCGRERRARAAAALPTPSTSRVGLPPTRLSAGPTPSGTAWESGQAAATGASGDWFEPTGAPEGVDGAEGVTDEAIAALERDVHARGRWTQVAVGFSMLAMVVLAAALYVESALLEDLRDGVDVSLGRVELNDQVVAGAVGWLIVTFFASTVLLMRYVHGATQLAVMRGVHGIEWTPRWAVLWWFIPLMNIWMPVRVLSAIYRAGWDGVSAQDGSSGHRRPSFTFGWWSGVFLVGTTLFVLGMTMRQNDALNDYDIEALIAGDVTAATGLLIAVLSGVLLLFVIRSLNRTPALRQ